MNTTIQLSLPPEQLALLQTIQQQNDKLIAHLNTSVWLTEEEAAARTKVSISTIRKWRTDGWLRYHKIEKTILFLSKELDEDLKKKGFVTKTRSI